MPTAPFRMSVKRHESDCPDKQHVEQFDQGDVVFRILSKRCGAESGKHQNHRLLDQDGEEHHQTCDGQPKVVAMPNLAEQQRKETADQCQDRPPEPGDVLIESVVAEHTVFKRVGMLGTRIKQRKGFGSEYQHQDAEAPGNDRGHQIDDGITNLEIGIFPRQQEDQDDQCRPGSACHGQEGKGQDCGCPHTHPGIAGEHEGCDDVDQRPPCDGQKDDRPEPYGQLFFMKRADIFFEQDITDTDKIQEQIDVQDDRVVREHRIGKVHEAQAGNDMPGPVRPAHVKQDEGDAGRNKDHGDDLAHHGQFLHILAMIEIPGGNNQDRCRRNVCREDEVGKERFQRDLVGRAGHDQSLGKLQVCRVGADQNEKRQEQEPGVVHPPAFYGKRTEIHCERQSCFHFVTSADVIKEFGIGAILFLEPEDTLGGQHSPDIAVGIEQVAEFSGAHRAGFQTGGIPALPGSLHAEGAFFHHAPHARPVAKVVGIRDSSPRQEGWVHPS